MTEAIGCSSELVMGWVHTWIGLGWVGSEFFYFGWVGLGGDLTA